MYCVQKIIIWDWMEVEYCKIRLWFASNITCVIIYKHILLRMYDISKTNLIKIFYNLLFIDEQTKSNHKII